MLKGAYLSQSVNCVARIIKLKSSVLHFYLLDLLYPTKVIFINSATGYCLSTYNP